MLAKLNSTRMTTFSLFRLNVNNKKSQQIWYGRDSTQTDLCFLLVHNISAELLLTFNNLDVHFLLHAIPQVESSSISDPRCARKNVKVKQQGQIVIGLSIIVMHILLSLLSQRNSAYSKQYDNFISGCDITHLICIRDMRLIEYRYVHHRTF